MVRRCSARSDFNPRSPRGERLALLPHGFQQSADFNPRSPRGERLSGRISPSPHSRFQSTLPSRGATIAFVLQPGRELHISIHAPLAGSDCTRRELYILSPLFQSTLPSRGATLPQCDHPRCCSNFNPRSPRGERLRLIAPMGGVCLFQSTLPSRGATLSSTMASGATSFQSTLPARGATAR